MDPQLGCRVNSDRVSLLLEYQLPLTNKTKRNKGTHTQHTSRRLNPERETPTLISRQSQSYSSPNPRAMAPHYITTQQHYIAKLQMLKILHLLFPFSTTSGTSYSTLGWHSSLFSLSLHPTMSSIHLPQHSRAMLMFPTPRAHSCTLLMLLDPRSH